MEVKIQVLSDEEFTYRLMEYSSLHDSLYLVEAVCMVEAWRGHLLVAEKSNT